MDARTLARLQAPAGSALGAGLVARPRRRGRRLGRRDRPDRRAGQALAAGLGARDVAIALGALRALRSGRGAAGWIRAGVLADAADLVGDGACTATRCRRSPSPAVAALAGGSVLLGAWLQRAVD